MPQLRQLVLGRQLWGLLPESWGRGTSFRSLQHVMLYGENRLHGLPHGATRVVINPAPQIRQLPCL